MCCITFFVKYLLFGVNLVFVLGGIGLVVAGIVVLTNITDILELIPVQVELVPIGAIVIGAVIFAIAFCGCCGAIVEKRYLLVLYGITMLVLTGLSIWFAVVLFNNLSDLRSLVETWLGDAFENEALYAPFQVLETSFQCCGTTGAESYINSGRAVPPTCCSSISVDDIINVTLPDQIPDLDICTIDNSFAGCNEKLGDFFSVFATPIAYVSIVIILVEVVAMIAAFYLNSEITDKRKTLF